MEIEALSNRLIIYGREHQMQDFYLLPQTDEYLAQFRRGPLYFDTQPMSIQNALQLINRFKYLGQMDVGEKRKTQYGAVSYSLPNGFQRLRLATVGDFRQKESMVIRFLHHFGTSPENYFFPSDVEVLKQQTRQRGLYLFCGPVASGKSTLMYKLAKNHGGQVITIEDPVELEEPNFLQLQINEKIQQTYDELIKLSLRYHPDVIIIGEIRDQKTLQGALRAALTGHCVYATIHAKSLAGARTRIFELGGDVSILTECLQGIIFQELLPYQDQLAVKLDFEFY